MDQTILIYRKEKILQRPLYPKCMNGTRTRALTADGYIVPCCWTDSYKSRQHKIYKQLFDPALHINNFENVEDIEDSIIWNKIEVMIDYGHEDLDICHRTCGRPNEKDTPFRQKIRSE